MLDAPGPIRTAAAPTPASRPVEPAAARRQRRMLLLAVLLVLALHAALLGKVGESLRFGADDEAGGGAISVRSIEAVPAASRAEEATPLAAAEALQAPAEPGPLPAPPPLAPRPARAVATAASAAGSRDVDAAANAESAASALVAPVSPPPLPTTAAAPTPTAAAEPVVAAAPSASDLAPAANSAGTADTASSSPTSPPALLAAGDAPPPTYPTQLPPAATLRYEVRRGLYRGSGEMRWQSAGGRYTLGLEARMVGFSLLTQSSSGAVGAHGLEPERFVDQRLRRPPIAANFHRDSETVTFSGSAQQWPLLPGTQDRLSVLVQLAGIVAAQPELAKEGGRVALVVVGARGDASVWTIHFAGFETVDTADGPVRAAKWVRKSRAVTESSAEIWLDPARAYFPIHATFRNSAGAAEYDLLLERLEMAP